MRERIEVFSNEDADFMKRRMNQFLERTEGRLMKIDFGATKSQSGTYGASTTYFASIVYIPGEPEPPLPQQPEEPRATRRIQILGEDE